MAFAFAGWLITFGDLGEAIPLFMRKLLFISLRSNGLLLTTLTNAMFENDDYFIIGSGVPISPTNPRDEPHDVWNLIVSILQYLILPISRKVRIPWIFFSLTPISWTPDLPDFSRRSLWSSEQLGFHCKVKWRLS